MAVRGNAKDGIHKGYKVVKLFGSPCDTEVCDSDRDGRERKRLMPWLLMEVVMMMRTMMQEWVKR